MRVRFVCVRDGLLPLSQFSVNYERTEREALNHFLNCIEYEARRLGLCTVGRMPYAPMILLPFTVEMERGHTATGFKYIMQCGVVIGHILRCEIPNKPRRAKKKKPKWRYQDNG